MILNREVIINENDSSKEKEIRENLTKDFFSIFKNNFEDGPVNGKFIGAMNSGVNRFIESREPSSLKVDFLIIS